MQSNSAAFVLWEAQRLAAAGDCEAALSLLDGLGPSPGAEAAILRGRILGQRSRFREAAESFRQALAAEPESEPARLGLAMAERLAKGPLGRARLRSRAVLAGTLALAVVFGLLWLADRLWVAPLRAEIATQGARAAAFQQSAIDQLRQVQSALDAERQDSGRAGEQTRAQLQRVQKQLAGTVTDAQLRATREEMLESLKRIEASMGQKDK